MTGRPLPRHIPADQPAYRPGDRVTVTDPPHEVEWHEGLTGVVVQLVPRDGYWLYQVVTPAGISDLPASALRPAFGRPR